MHGPAFAAVRHARGYRGDRDGGRADERHDHHQPRSRDRCRSVVNITVAGTATRGVDYVTLPATATIPAGAASVDLPVVPLDDATLEANETVVLTLRTGAGYVLAPPTVGTVTLVSDDVAPDFAVTGLTAPSIGGAG